MPRRCDDDGPPRNGDPCPGAVWRVRRPLRAGDADPGARRTGSRVHGRGRRPRVYRRGPPVPERFLRAADPALLRPAADRGPRRRADLSEARGPPAHRRPQDQQHDRPGAPRPPHGQAPDHRRDRRGPARGGDGHRGGRVWTAVRRLHGDGRHGAPGPQRHSHADPGGPRHPRRLRQPDAQGRHQRGAARLGHPRRHDPLRPRVRRRAAPLPHDRPGLPIGDRPGGARAGAGGGGPAAGLPGRLRRGREQRDGAVPSI